ncbi:MAG: hypothetical protein ABI402_19040 [Ferruginibacter sp.]
MKFDKNKNEDKNIEILKKEIKKTNTKYSKVLIDLLFSPTTSEEFRIRIKDSISAHIENEIKN